MAMTNEQIIFNEAQQLAKDGKIGYTGRVFEMELADGNTIQVKETEEIHTFAKWKSLGFQVQKGQKAIAKFTIWKYAAKVDKETGEEESGKMFMKQAAFFSATQVAPITE